MGREPKSARDKADEQRYLKRLGKQVRELREAKKLSTKDLATKLGVTPQYIYMIEAGRAKPSEKRLNELARALGDLADAFLSTALEHVEGEFAAKLREAGLTLAEIEEAAHRVSARVKKDVVSGKEPLRVARGQAPEAEIFGALDAGERIVAMEDADPFLRDQSLASDYAKLIRDEFKSKAPEVPPMQSRKAAAPRQQTVKAGPNAHIVVDRPLDRNERKALQDVARVIAHLLGR